MYSSSKNLETLADLYLRLSTVAFDVKCVTSLERKEAESLRTETLYTYPPDGGTPACRRNQRKRTP